MAQAPAKKRQRARSGPLTVILLLVLLAGVGMYLRQLQEQVADAEAEKARLTEEVALLQQENEALAADISEGATPEKIGEIAREELGLVASGEYVFDIVS